MTDYTLEPISAQDPITSLPSGAYVPVIIPDVASSTGFGNRRLSGDAIPQTFDTVADMVASDLSVGKPYKTLGYYSVGDGGGAEYVGYPTGTTADGYADHGAASGVAVLQIEGNQFDIRKFGALIGSDSYLNISAALTKASTVGNAEVIVPLAGFYECSSTLTIPSGVKLKGRGTRRGTAGIRFTYTGNIPSISIANGYYSEVSSLNLTHQTLADAGTAILLQDNDGSGTGTDPAQYFNCSDVRVNNHATGVRISSESTWCDFVRVIVEGCSSAAYSVTNANLTTFTKCIADGCGTAWYLEGTTKTILDSCTAQVCSSTTSAAINILNCDAVTLINPWFERNGFHNVHVRGTSRLTRIVEPINQGAGYTSASGRGIYLDGTSTGTIIDGGWHGGNATNDITIGSTVTGTVLIDPRSTGTLSVVDSAADTFYVSRQMRGVKGISATATAANNLRGSVTISNTATSAVVTFPTAEVNASYYIQATVASVSGSPATGSWRLRTGGKSTTGFTVLLEVAPGSGNSVTIDWLLVR